MVNGLWPSQLGVGPAQAQAQAQVQNAYAPTPAPRTGLGKIEDALAESRGIIESIIDELAILRSRIYNCPPVPNEKVVAPNSTSLEEAVDMLICRIRMAEQLAKSLSYGPQK